MMSNRFQRRTGRFRAGFGFALLLTVLILLALLCDPEVQSRLPWNQSRAPETQAEGELTVYFLDVGQGDAALLRSAGATMLIWPIWRSWAWIIWTTWWPPTPMRTTSAVCLGLWSGLP